MDPKEMKLGFQDMK